ncbi:MAG: hypothetical protein QGF68_09140 [Nitrospinota bacterium]|jgi:hypothetical protein|nr:hypothetical protein [Nitrospinota bacterium]MDP7385234.1 hypothetical protein [Nitrospinota bacterium]
MYWVQKGLLFFHLIGLGLYIGFHAVTYLLSARIQTAREAGEEEGGAEELANSRMLFRVLVMAVWGLVLLLSSGLAMSILSGYGFFGTTWLTIKHVAFFAMILNTSHLLFIMRLLGRELASVSGPPVSEAVRALVERRKPFGFFNEVMTVIIILSGVFRF